MLQEVLATYAAAQGSTILVNMSNLVMIIFFYTIYITDYSYKYGRDCVPQRSYRIVLADLQTAALLQQWQSQTKAQVIKEKYLLKIKK